MTGRHYATLPDLLTRAGRCAYGKNWHSPLARDLNTTRETVCRWANGTHKIPDGALDEAIKVMRNHMASSRANFSQTVKTIRALPKSRRYPKQLKPHDIAPWVPLRKVESLLGSMDDF